MALVVEVEATTEPTRNSNKDILSTIGLHGNDNALGNVSGDVNNIDHEEIINNY